MKLLRCALVPLLLALFTILSCDSSGGSGTNHRPVANAGADRDVPVGVLVALDGSGSSDPDGNDLTYSWKLVSAPGGSQAQLAEPAKLPAKSGGITHPTPILVPDIPGVYQAELVVNDGSAQSEPDRVLIRASLPGAACGIPQQFGISTPDCPNSSGINWKKLSQVTPGNGNTLSIGAGETYQYVYVDGDGQGANQFSEINIGQGGRLVFLDTVMKAAAVPNLTVSTINVSGGTDDGLPKGQLVIGTEEWPIQLSQVSLLFTGDRPADSDPKKMTQKGIIVTNDGELSLHGKKGVPAAPPAAGDTAGTVSWTYLSAAAGPSAFSSVDNAKVPVPTQDSDTTLALATSVDWQPGDWIAVAGTGFVEDQTEFVQIQSVDNSGPASVISLNPQTPLLHYHFGGLAPSQGTIPPGGTTCNDVTLIGDATTDGLPASFCDGADRNYGVDERAEVGLISRNVKLSSDAENTSTKHFGGQIYIGPDAFAEIEGVEIEKFGQDVSSFVNMTQVGAYPILLDTVNGSTGNVTVNANSIHHSYNKVLGLRGATNLNITNNVAARFIGHGMYLETGNESGNLLTRNLVAGAGATDFTPFFYQMPDAQLPPCFRSTVPAPPPVLPEQSYSYWKGDYLGNDASPYYNGFDSFGVMTTSDNSRLEYECPTNFFITNPQNRFTYNSAAGNQIQGRGFWNLPATASIGNYTLAEFTGNRAHGCYNGVDNATDLGIQAFNHTPTVDGKDVFALYKDVTATRNRNRGIWLRPSWNVILNARLATNRNGASLVSAGGAEGSPPGEWGLLKDSVLVGVSENNPERFGPCPCIGSDGTCYGVDPALVGNGVPTPLWNLGGYMFYDGPARLENNRFINFNTSDDKIEEELTASDYQWIHDQEPGQVPGKTFPDPNDSSTGKFFYEGDAAQMWFQSNINGYPPTQYSMGNTWENTDFRHQIYTEETFLAAFTDGDKNTVIVDRDGSLTGYRVYGMQGGAWTLLENKYAMSLNNLAFNGTPWSVDECLSTGLQDLFIEMRSTSLISPHSYARLVVNGFYPEPVFTGGPSQRFPFTFVKDTFDLSDTPSDAEYAATWGKTGHYYMTLGGRNDTQNRELQVMNGMGYTIHSDDHLYAQDGLNIAPPMALPRYMGLMFTDASLTEKEIDGNLVAAAPFRIRLGLCYKTTKNDLSSTLNPSTFFEVKRGRISLGAPTGGNDYDNWLTVPNCNNFPLSPNGNSWDPANNAPAVDCPGTMHAGTDPIITLSQAGSYTDFTNQASDPASSLDLYWWDADKGMLFFFMEQKEVNLSQASPLGSCTGGPDDPPECEISVQGKPVDFFYSCPEEGCVMYTVRVVDEDNLGYDPASMGCTACADVYTPTTIDYAQTYPPNDTVSWETDRLGVAETGTVVTEDLIIRFFENVGYYWFPNVLGFNGIYEYSKVGKNFPFNIINPDSAPPDCVESP